MTTCCDRPRSRRGEEASADEELQELLLYFVEENNILNKVKEDAYVILFIDCRSAADGIYTISVFNGSDEGL